MKKPDPPILSLAIDKLADDCLSEGFELLADLVEHHRYVTAATVDEVSVGHTFFDFPPAVGIAVLQPLENLHLSVCKNRTRGNRMPIVMGEITRRLLLTVGLHDLALSENTLRTTPTDLPSSPQPTTLGLDFRLSQF